MVKKEDINKYSFLLILLVLIFSVFIIVKPFITSILTSFIIAYIFYPFYKRLNNKIKKKNISAIIVSLLIILIFSIPFIFIINALVKEVNLGYVEIKKTMTGGNFFNVDCKKITERETGLCRFSDSIKKIVSDQKFELYMQRMGITITTYVTEGFSKLIISVPKILLNIFLILFLTFYLFKDGKLFFYKVFFLLPLKKKNQEDIVKTFNDVVYATIYGQIIVAVIQGALGGIGFYLFGVSSPIFWGTIMILLSLIPFIGSSIIWAPAALYLIISGLASSNNPLFFKGIGLFIYGLLIISLIDNILRPKIVGERIGMHPALVFIGVIGGLMLFGPLGILLGPLLIAVLIVFGKIYQKREFL